MQYATWWEIYTPVELTWQWNVDPLKMYFLVKMGKVLRVSRKNMKKWFSITVKRLKTPPFELADILAWNEKSVQRLCPGRPDRACASPEAGACANGAEGPERSWSSTNPVWGPGWVREPQVHFTWQECCGFKEDWDVIGAPRLWKSYNGWRLNMSAGFLAVKYRTALTPLEHFPVLIDVATGNQ